MIIVLPADRDQHYDRDPQVRSFPSGRAGHAEMYGLGRADGEQEVTLAQMAQRLRCVSVSVGYQ